MTLKLSPITPFKAWNHLVENTSGQPFGSDEISFAVSVTEDVESERYVQLVDPSGENPTQDISVSDTKAVIRGVIAMKADGNECSLLHMYTDGTALVGSILYGAAWRAAKALGYKAITI